MDYTNLYKLKRERKKELVKHPHAQINFKSTPKPKSIFKSTSKPKSNTASKDNRHLAVKPTGDIVEEPLPRIELHQILGVLRPKGLRQRAPYLFAGLIPVYQFQLQGIVTAIVLLVQPTPKWDHRDLLEDGSKVDCDFVGEEPRAVG